MLGAQHRRAAAARRAGGDGAPRWSSCCCSRPARARCCKGLGCGTDLRTLAAAARARALALAVLRRPPSSPTSLGRARAAGRRSSALPQRLGPAARALPRGNRRAGGLGLAARLATRATIANLVGMALLACVTLRLLPARCCWRCWRRGERAAGRLAAAQVRCCSPRPRACCSRRALTRARLFSLQTHHTKREKTMGAIFQSLGRTITRRRRPPDRCSSSWPSRGALHRARRSWLVDVLHALAARACPASCGSACSGTSTSCRLPSMPKIPDEQKPAVEQGHRADGAVLVPLGRDGDAGHRR